MEPSRFRELIEYAPKLEPGFVRKGPVAWVYPDGHVYCWACVTRVSNRGFLIPAESVPNWDGPARCECCERWVPDLPM